MVAPPQSTVPLMVEPALHALLPPELLELEDELLEELELLEDEELLLEDEPLVDDAYEQ